MRDFLEGVGRMLVVSVTTALVIIFILAVAFSGQNQQERDAIDEIRRGTLANVCVLALPIDEGGRKPAQVQACLERYGLEP